MLGNLLTIFCTILLTLFCNLTTVQHTEIIVEKHVWMVPLLLGCLWMHCIMHNRVLMMGLLTGPLACSHL